MTLEELMTVFRAWSTLHPHKRGDECRLEFRPDGAGRLKLYSTDTVLDFSDADEVMAYMKRRLVPTA